MTKILLIDNDLNRLRFLTHSLSSDGYEVFTADTGNAGIKLAWHQSPEIVILNLLLPTMDGFEACRRMRELGIPFILVTSVQHNEKSVIKALEMGADDYIRYPIEIPVLLVKLRTLMRRTNGHSLNKLTIYDDGYLLIDMDVRRVEVEGKAVKLTPTEFRLLSILLKKMGKVVSHEELIKEIWGTEKDTSLGSLKLYIHYLRQKIEVHPRNPHYLLAEWGVGYRFKEIQADIVN